MIWISRFTSRGKTAESRINGGDWFKSCYPHHPDKDVHTEMNVICDLCFFVFFVHILVCLFVCMSICLFTCGGVLYNRLCLTYTKYR